MKKLKIKNIILRSLVLFVAIILTFVVTVYDLNVSDDLDYIYSTFIGSKSDYNGIIEVWNIDSFESGLKSKTSYLETIAKKFQRKYKGVYVMVRNLTLGECLNLINSGETPDIFSCSYGVADKLQGNFVPFEKPSEFVFANFLEAGKKDNQVYGLAWCVGNYCLISTRAKLESAGKEFDGVKLNEIAYLATYNYKIGKKEKISKSLCFGTGQYLMPKNALNAYNKARSIQINESAQDELNFRSNYSAYTSFLSNDATILLGTHRDVFRVQNREEQGKIGDVIYLPLDNWTDLVQFSFLSKKGDSKRNIAAENFANYLTEPINQESIENIGMFPVTKVDDTNFNGVMRDIILENFSDYELKKLF